MKDVRVAKWEGAGFLSQQPRFDSRPGTYHEKKRNIKAAKYAFNDYKSRKVYLKNYQKKKSKPL